MMKIANYGYVPFPYFQWVMYGLQLLLIMYHKPINRFLEHHVNPEKKKWITFVKKVVYTIPILAIAYYDIRYSSFSLKNLGVNPDYNHNINQVLFILGSYGLIQVLAQDSGLKTGLVQRETVQTHIWFAFMAVGMAFSLTNNRSQSILALIIYFHLKYVISDNMTSPVCFEEV